MPLPSSACVLCGKDGLHDRVCGFDLCSVCGFGNLDSGLERWGLTLEQRRWREQVGSGDNKSMADGLEVKVSFPTKLAAQAHFRQETGFDRLGQWWKATEPQGDEPLFDRAIFVDESSGADLTTIVRDEGVQTAIMELVATGGVRLGDGWVRARRLSSMAYPEFSETAVPLVLLAVHLETCAQLIPPDKG